MVTMKPEPDDMSVSIPVTFDYRGGRNENKKQKIILTLVTLLITIALVVIIMLNKKSALYMRLLIAFAVLAVENLFLRFIIFKETVYSDIYEKLKEVDFMPDSTCFWTIYDIDHEYPYICHFMSGYKGMFVRMEKDVVVGKSSTVMYDHFEAISDALNMASSMNINICHVDYMDNVGNDPRLARMYENLKDVDNPDMQDVLLDMYQHLQDEMSRDYTSFDIYVFYTKDKVENLMYNVQMICSQMLGGNFLSYKVLDSSAIRQVCMSLYNLVGFSVINASELLLKGSSHAGIVPISLEHGDGSYEKINKTVEEKRQEAEERARLEAEAKENAKKSGGRKSGRARKGSGKAEANVGAPQDAGMDAPSVPDTQVSTGIGAQEDEELDLF